MDVGVEGLEVGCSESDEDEKDCVSRSLDTRIFIHRLKGAVFSDDVSSSDSRKALIARHDDECISIHRSR
jgi:hypothetical protein